MKKLGFISLLIALSFCFYACSSDNLTEVTSEGMPTTTAVPTSEGIPTRTEETIEFTYADGFYDFSDASSDLRETFLASAENYLLENMSGGIPLFTPADYLVYNSRVILPTTDYINFLDYAHNFGSMSLDDTHVLRADGLYGNSSEYTFRTTIYPSIFTYNHWYSDTSSERDLIDLYLDSLYELNVNDTQNGYSLEPSLASNNPIAINGSTNDYGGTISTTWQIPIKSDLEWFFSPDTDQLFIDTLEASDLVINAVDFVDTYKLAIDNQWFRAISGGGDFVNSVQRIEGLQEYIDGTGTWEEVGIKVVDDNLQFTFIINQESWDVMYWLSSVHLTPINTLLYDYLENDGDSGTSYGDGYSTIAYSGPYYLTSLTEDLITLKENPSYYDDEKYSYTGFELYLTNEYSEIKTLYDDGYLDFFSVNVDDFSQYTDDNNVVVVPGNMVYRLNLNATGTETEFNELFPDSTYIPEPILANQDFRLAMFYVIDREELTETIGFGLPSDRYITEGFVVGIEEGISFRDSLIGSVVGNDMDPDLYGYNPSKALEYFELAIETLVADEAYQEGTVDNYTIINIELDFVMTSDTQRAIATFIKDAFEEIFTSSEYFIKVNVTVNETEFPNIYFENQNTGEFDMFIGGISGSLLCPTNLLDLYCSDNRSGFLLNFGYDTSLAEIEVSYTDMYGELKHEIWSFDAIASALYGEVYIQEGEEAPNPETIET